jgi:UDP-N-acetylmuramoyl-tripeptide--D-alanyl-D-alanine ligase
MLAALNLLDELEGRKVAVLGDMLELGPYERGGHEMVGLRAAQVANVLLTLGERAHLVEWLRGNLTKNDTVLIKGSHGLRMDRITSSLEVRS